MDYNGEEPVHTGVQHTAAAHHKFTLEKALALVVGALLFCGIGVFLGVTQGPAIILDVSPTLAQELGFAEVEVSTDQKTLHDGYDGELARRLAAVSLDALNNALSTATLDQSTATTLVGRLRASGDTHAAYLDPARYNSFIELAGSPAGYASTEAPDLSVWSGELGFLQEYASGSTTAASYAVSSFLTADGVGVVTVGLMSRDTASHVAIQLDNLIAQGAVAFVLDLRTSTGGYLHEAIQVASLFLEGGTICEVTQQTGSTRLGVEPGRTHYPQPLVLVVSQKTAGAAEVVASALQEHGRANIVGERTKGDATVQCLRTLSFGGAVMYTTATLYTPDGNTFEGMGVIPNVKRNSFISVLDQKAQGVFEEASQKSEIPTDTILAFAIETVSNGS